MDISEFRFRRERLLQEMQEGVAIIPTAPEVIRNRDSHYPYRFDSYFYYLTGFTEPEALLVLVAGKAPKTVLFCREKNLEREIWDGFRHGPAAAMNHFGFDEAYTIEEAEALLPKLLANQPKLFFSLGADKVWDERVLRLLQTLRTQARSGINAPQTVVDVRQWLDEMRLIKSEAELDVMRRSALIATKAHLRAMQTVQPGLYEYEIEAELLHTFYRHGAQAPAYTSIVAGGANACTLHYNANNAKLLDGDLLLIDAGCELDGYASDITRTFPVNGRFEPAQKDLYQLVLDAQAAAIAQVVPGHAWNAPHEAALAVLVDGFIHYGLCQGSRDEVLENGSYRQFYMHRTGHWLGLDVHDAGEYKSGQDWRVLTPGMVLTVEPGCYVRPAEHVPEHFWDIGIRIEDDVVVSASDACEVLSKNAPKRVDEIEQTIAAQREKTKNVRP